MMHVSNLKDERCMCSSWDQLPSHWNWENNKKKKSLQQKGEKIQKYMRTSEKKEKKHQTFILPVFILIIFLSLLAIK